MLTNLTSLLQREPHIQYGLNDALRNMIKKMQFVPEWVRSNRRRWCREYRNQCCPQCCTWCGWRYGSWCGRKGTGSNRRHPRQSSCRGRRSPYFYQSECNGSSKSSSLKRKLERWAGNKWVRQLQAGSLKHESQIPCFQSDMMIEIDSGDEASRNKAQRPKTAPPNHISRSGKNTRWRHGAQIVKRRWRQHLPITSISWAKTKYTTEDNRGSSEIPDLCTFLLFFIFFFKFLHLFQHKVSHECGYGYAKELIFGQRRDMPIPAEPWWKKFVMELQEKAILTARRREPTGTARSRLTGVEGAEKSIDRVEMEGGVAIAGAGLVSITLRYCSSISYLMESQSRILKW